MKSRHPVWLVCVLLLGLSARISIADEVIARTEAGGINWSQGEVFAIGYGTARPGQTEGQRRILSRRAAIVDAQRRLLEITKGVRISSEYVTGQMMQKSPAITSRVEGIVRGAVVVEDHFQNEVATVRMSMPLAGDFLKVLYPRQSVTTATILGPASRRFIGSIDDAILLLGGGVDRLLNQLVPAVQAADEFVIRSEDEAESYRKLLRWLESAGPTNAERTLIDAIERYESNSQYSGLLIDASGVSDFELATIPRIRDEEGNVLYPSESTRYDDIVNKRGVTYDFDLEDAIRHERVATTPFRIEAFSIYKNLPSDLVISKEDAARILQSPTTLEAMNRAGVLIVVAI